MTRSLPGSVVRIGTLDCRVLSTARCGDRVRANVECLGERIPNVPAVLLAVIAPPPAVPKFQLRGIA